MTADIGAAQERAIDEVIALLRPLLGVEGTERWFHARHRRLQGCRPCDLILAGRLDLVVDTARSHAAQLANQPLGPAGAAGPGHGQGPPTPDPETRSTP